MCLYTNANSLMGKMEELRERVKRNKYGIVTITETWANEQVNDAELTIDGYTMYRKDRQIPVNKRTIKGGGILIYVKEDLDSVLSTRFTQSAFQESLWVEVKASGGCFLLGVCYRSPLSTAQNDDELLQLLDEAVETIGASHLLLLGDFNYPHIDFANNKVNAGEESSAFKFFTKTQDLFLIQHIEECTRVRQGQKPSLIDYLFTEEDNLIDDIIHDTPLGKSDHVCLSFSYLFGNHVNCRGENHQRPNYWRGKYDRIIAALSLVDWRAEFSECGVEEVWTKFKGRLLRMVELHVPLRDLDGEDKKQKCNSWITKHTRRQVRKRNEAWQHYRDSGSEEIYAEYKKIRNIVNRCVKRDKQDYQAALIGQFKNYPKKFYAYVRRMQTVKSTVTRLKNKMGVLTSDDREAAEVLCEHFQDVFVRENPSTQIKAHVARKDLNLDITFSPTLIAQKLNHLRPEKSPGPDKLPPLVLKSCACVLSAPLSILFQMSFDQGIIPADWKLADIVPIFKKGNRSEVGNYRPISLSSVVCKVMESIIKDALLKKTQEANFISRFQHGFLPKRSCLTNLLETFEAWTGLLDEGFAVDVIYLDYKKAFDTVPHQKLLIKLREYGFESRLVEWIRAFLSKRKMRVIVNGCSSGWVGVLSGVPQGSVLGPLLFLLYVNDIPDWVTGNVRMFADDTKIWRKIEGREDSEELQKDLDRLNEWSEEWLMQFNPDKCRVMHLGGREKYSYSITQANEVFRLAETNQERDLGVMVTSDMKSSVQCAKAAAKSMAMLGLVKRQFKNIGRKEFEILYKCYVRPHMEYCVQSWSPHLKRDISCLERVQRRATKLVNGMKGLDYQRRLKVLNLTTLEKRRLRGDLIEAFKIAKGLDDVNVEAFFRRAPTEHNLRGHSLKFQVQGCRLDCRKHSFSRRVVSWWNRLSEEVVASNTVNAFKVELDKWFDSVDMDV